MKCFMCGQEMEKGKCEECSKEADICISCKICEKCADKEYQDKLARIGLQERKSDKREETLMRLENLGNSFSRFGQCCRYYVKKMKESPEKWTEAESIAYEPYLKMTESLMEKEEGLDVMLVVAYDYVRGLNEEEIVKDVAEFVEKQRRAKENK